MTTILIAGLAVLDFVFFVEEMPSRAEKYRAKEASIVGGGGAANAAVAISRLGGRAILAARLGRDPVGDMVVAGLEQEGVDCSLVEQLADFRTPYSSVLVDKSGERQIVNFRDDRAGPGNEILKKRMPFQADAALADTRWPDGAEAAFRAARTAGRPAVLDAEPPVEFAAAALELATHVAFSAQGLREFAGTDDKGAALRTARERTKAFVCVTDGAAGVDFLDGERVRNAPAFRVQPVDTLGAGDVWHGAFAIALGENRSEEDAIRFANAAAALKCTRIGGRAGAPTRAETEAFMREAA